MKISLSNQSKGVLGVVGHVGCGHCHSHSNQVQDDSAGLAVVLALFQAATGVSLVIKDIRVQAGVSGFFEVETEAGGLGRAYPRRGVTLQEARAAKGLVGQEAVLTQALVFDAFGRCYGQGIHEAPVSLQTAIANAALDTFVKNFPHHFQSGIEDISGSCGLIAGAVLDIDGIPVSVLGTVNASEGGIGPNEDLEGNVALGIKRLRMDRLGLLDLPTIVIEGKIYNEKYLSDIDGCSFVVRADNELDNLVVAQSIVNAGASIDIPVLFKENAVPRIANGMANTTQALGAKIAGLGEQLKSAGSSQEKVAILADLAVLISQDGGGSSFMSNKLNEIVGGAGMMPGTSAVFNYVVTKDYIAEVVVPFLTTDDLQRYVQLTLLSIKELAKLLPEAKDSLHRRGLALPIDNYIAPL